MPCRAVAASPSSTNQVLFLSELVGNDETASVMAAFDPPDREPSAAHRLEHPHFVGPGWQFCGFDIAVDRSGAALLGGIDGQVKHQCQFLRAVSDQHLTR